LSTILIPDSGQISREFLSVALGTSTVMPGANEMTSVQPSFQMLEYRGF
jgi:hypothetical protein